MIRRLCILLAVTGLLLAACGDDDADETSDASETTTVDDGGEDTAAGDGTSADAAVIIADFSFEPASIETSTGAAVTWTNEDGVTHTVTAGEPGSPADAFDESLDSGDTAEVTFDEAGTFPYFCSIHPNMTGEVVVS